MHQTTQPLDRVAMWAVDRDEMEFDPAGWPCQPSLHQFRVMVSGIVQINVNTRHYVATATTTMLLYRLDCPAMLPSFFTGNLITRFVTVQVMDAGAAILCAVILVALVGIDAWNFRISLALNGVGWNFMFVGPPCSSPPATARRSGAGRRR